MSTTDEYAEGLIERLEAKGDDLSLEAAEFIRAERVRIVGYRKMVEWATAQASNTVVALPGEAA